MSDALLADLRALADAMTCEWTNRATCEETCCINAQVAALITKHTPEPNGVIYKAGQEAAQAAALLLTKHSQVTELEDDWGYGHAYDDWKVHEILVKVAIPLPLRNYATREYAIEIVKRALDDAGLDIGMEVQE